MVEVKTKFEKQPSIIIDGTVYKGGCSILEYIRNKYPKQHIVAVDTYIGANMDEISEIFNEEYAAFNTLDCFKGKNDIERITFPDVTDDEVFGFISRLSLIDFFDEEKVHLMRQQILQEKKPIVLVGPGAYLVIPEADVKIYADMARWEIQSRMKAGLVNGLGVENNSEPFSSQYKRGFFVDWRVCDKHKKEWFLKSDFLLDSNKEGDPQMVSMVDIKAGLNQAVSQPLSLVPFFDPGPWGGHWMEKVFDLETKGAPNHAWCFNCVPEENSLLFKINDDIIELPSIDLVFFESNALLGEAVEARFGKEFPIRFDFLDTMGGGNLSLQVHPDTTYIQENFGMHYTQDESYYLLEAGDDAVVYLGLREDADAGQMFADLEKAQKENEFFDAERYVNKYPAGKHDHFLIPAGTIHCSGKNSMVLEISSTPYIFTFKMWDWGRLGLDGNPRPINIKHARNVVKTDRRKSFVENELINQIQVLEKGDGWIEEKTGLHEREFIETRRHWFSKTVTHQGNGSVNVLMLVEGEEAIVESPNLSFDPFFVNYAEAFIIPAAIDSYTITPYGKSLGKTICTVKAYVRF